MKISMDKKYRTFEGSPVRIICIDRKDELYPVIALIADEITGEEVVRSFTLEGMYGTQDYLPTMNLVEVTEWDKFKIDEPVMVCNVADGCNASNAKWYRGYFAGVVNGRPVTWNSGSTSWSNYGGRISWQQCRRPTKEEMKLA